MRYFLLILAVVALVGCGKDKASKQYAPADFNKDGVVTLTELNLSITYTVKEITGGRQHPTTQIPANLPDFPLFVR